MTSEYTFVEGKDNLSREQALMEEGIAHYKAGRYLLALNAYEKAITLNSRNVDAYVGEGDCHRNRDHYSLALRSYNKAISIDPTNISAYNGMCYAYVKQGNITDALQANKKAMELDPSGAIAHNGKGLILHLQKKYEESIQAYDQAIQLTTNKKHIAGYFFNKGQVFYDLARYDEALDAYDEALQYDPENTKFLTVRTQAIYEIEEYLKSIKNQINENGSYKQHDGYELQLLNYKIRQQPENISLYLAKGHYLYKRQCYEKALQAYADTKRFAIHLDEIYSYIGNTLYMLERYEEALDAYLKAITYNPKNMIALSGKANTLSQLKEYEEALLAYNDAIRLEPQITFFYSKGCVYYEQDKYQYALLQYRYAICLSERYTKAYLGEGKTLRKLGEYKEALLSYKCAFEIEPHSGLILKEMADILYLLERHEEALDTYRKAIQLDSTLMQAYVSLGHIYFEKKCYQEALQMYELVKTTNIEDIHYYSNLGDIFISLNRYEDALQAYDKALQLNPSLIIIHARRGKALLEKKRYPEALMAYKNAVTLDKEDLFVYLGLADILVALDERRSAAEYYQKALSLLVNETSLDLLWAYIFPVSVVRPAYIQLMILQHFLRCTQIHIDPRVDQSFDYVGKVYEQLFHMSNIVSEDSIQILKDLLTMLHENKREDALLRVAQRNDIRIAQLLIQLAPAQLSGLSKLACRIAREWNHKTHPNNLAVLFASTLSSYQVEQYDIDIFRVRNWIAQGLYDWAEPLLVQIVAQNQLGIDALWLYVEVLHQCEKSPELQLDMLKQCVQLAPNDSRTAEAYQHIGDLYAYRLNAGMEAISAYKEAEKRGLVIPQLQAFREGKWDEIPAFRTHSDYSFPPVVVIDIENDYQPEAALGSRVFEIGAIRSKGRTELETYNAVIRRSFTNVKVKNRQNEAKELAQVVKELQAFIDASRVDGAFPIIVGHSMQAFDAKHLREMGVPIEDDWIVDTLIFARYLYPDSLHHHLKLLCDIHNITFQGDAHNALPDAQACALLLHALGEELVQCDEELIQRGEKLLAGFRAFIPPNSAFDRAVLQPRNIIVSPHHVWELDPTPTLPRVLTILKDVPASRCILDTFDSRKDALIESYDPNAAYVQHIPRDQRTVVLVNTRSRLERILAASKGRSDLFVLPDPQTLLCPERVRKYIVQAETYHMKLELFCLYQASHNHDARTLYPLRIPTTNMSSGDVTVKHLNDVRNRLLASCCGSDDKHTTSCLAISAMNVAVEKSSLLLATHESFLHHSQDYHADENMLIVDEVDKLQMHFAEYLAKRIESQWVRAESKEVFDILDKHIVAYCNKHVEKPGFRERLDIKGILPSPEYVVRSGEESLWSKLTEAGVIGAKVAEQLKNISKRASQQGKETHVHAYWLDVWFSSNKDSGDNVVQWSFGGVSRNLQDTFQRIFWQPYQQHILCGTAVTLNASSSEQGTEFIKRFFSLPKAIPFYQDQRPLDSIHKVYIPPDSADFRPASFLNRKSWAKSVGTFLYRLVLTKQQSIMVTLHSTPIADALTDAFSNHKKEQHLPQYVLSPHLGWTMTKIIERLSDGTMPTLTFLSPRQRRLISDETVEIEATGPMRFLNQRDPLIAAQIYAFIHQEKEATAESTIDVMTKYLLPQALLELKSRVSSSAKLHIILDSSLRTSIYRDEVYKLFKQDELWDELKISDVPLPDVFDRQLENELERQGFGSEVIVSDEDLLLTLRTLWNVSSFRISPLNQEAIIRSTLEKKDQFVIAATGGGKSLCFQLPAVLLSQDIVPQVTIVISPLIALMKDQVDALNEKGIFSAIMLNSTLNGVERRNVLQGIERGNYSIIYMAPEQIRSSALIRALKKREVGLIAFDEAHCLSQWGHNFRTDYFEMKAWVDTHIAVGQRNFPLLALTATARKTYTGSDNQEQSTVKDIIEKLGLKKHDTHELLSENNVQQEEPARKELQLEVELIKVPCGYCDGELAMEMNDVYCASCKRTSFLTKEEMKEEIRKKKLEKLVALLTDESSTSLGGRWKKKSYASRLRGIIYCRTRAETEKVTEEIGARVPTLRVAAYHAESKEKSEIQQRFMRSDKDGLDIIVATNAFGMGIDVRRLGFVIHFDVPATPEAYYQEAGRAGRDKTFSKDNPARCILLYHEHDLEGQRYLQDTNKITEQQIESVYKVLRDLKHSNDSTLFVALQTIGIMACIEEKQIATILYYLEHHTEAHGKPVIARGKNVSRIWHLQLETTGRTGLSLSMKSEQLLDEFHTSEKFRLKEASPTEVDVDDLATHLGWKVSELEDEIVQLVGKHYIAPKNNGQMRLKKSNADVQQLLEHLETDTYTILKSMKELTTSKGKKELVMLGKILQSADVEWLTMVAHFLFYLSCQRDEKNWNEPLLFKKFERDLKSQKSHAYKFELRQGIDNEQVCKALFQRLRQVLKDLEGEYGIKNDKLHEFDMLRVEKQYSSSRQKFYQHLLALMILNIIEYQQEMMDSAVCIEFLQDKVSEYDLKIELSLLRLIEKGTARKLELMREYATTLKEEDRVDLLNRYFLGQIPLFKPFELNAKLTEEQREIVTLKNGYHLVEGPGGSGKTETLVEHIRYLVDYMLVPEEHILVATHYHSASDSIGGRCEGIQTSKRRIKTRTLQSLANEIFLYNRSLLRKYDGQPYYSGKPPRLIKGDEYKRLIKEVLWNVAQGIWVREPWPTKLAEPHIPRNVDDEKLFDQCLKAINMLREHGVFPSQVPSEDEVCSALAYKVNKDRIPFYYVIYINYLLLLGKEGLYTYEDQTLFALVILKQNPQLLAQRSVYEHIIIDEFQDLTPAQSALVGLLGQKYGNVMAFGDDVQDIRVKEVGEIDLDERFGWLESCELQEHSLTTNFRSKQEILDLVATVHPKGEREPQLGKREERGIKPQLICVPYNKDTLHTIVDKALHEFEQLDTHDKGSVALMVAKSDQLQNVKSYLEQKNCTFSLLQSTYRFQSSQARKVFAYFRLIEDNTGDEYAETILQNSKVFGYGLRNDLKREAKRMGRPLLELVRQRLNEQQELTEEQEAFKEHLALFDSGRFMPDGPFVEVLQAIKDLPHSPFIVMEENEGKNEDVEQVFEELKKYKKGITVKEALAYVDSHVNYRDECNTQNNLFLTTIDNAKSQEFDTVFLLGAHELKDKHRWYVAISRARERFFFLVGEDFEQENKTLSDLLLNRDLYCELSHSKYAKDGAI